MNEIVVWHNPSCSKSRAASAELTGLSEDVVLRKYRDEPPTVAELEEVLAKLDAEPWDITRLNESVAKDLGMSTWPREDSDRHRWLEALHENPILIQRPIVISGDRAVVARDPGWQQKLQG